MHQWSSCSLVFPRDTSSTGRGIPPEELSVPLQQALLTAFPQALQAVFPSNRNIPTHILLARQVIPRKVPAFPVLLCYSERMLDSQICLFRSKPVNKMGCLDETGLFFWFM